MTSKFSMVRSIVALMVVGMLCACQHETHHTGPARVKAQTPDTTLVGLSRILNDGQHVGWLKTFRYEDRDGSRISKVIDLKDDSLGYITADGRAFRFTAHDGPILVGSSDDVRRNVAAVMGVPLAKIEVRQEVEGV